MATSSNSLPDLVLRTKEFVAPVLSYRSSLEITHGDGSKVTASDGREFLDFTTGIACLNLGHNHPQVVAAVHEQVDRLWHAGWATYRYRALVDAAERLVQITPGRVEQVLLMNSGAEAVEASVKLAKKSSGRQGVIVFRGGFHGRTMGSVTYTTSKSEYREGYHPLVPSVFVTPFPHPFGWGMPQADADVLALDELRRKFKYEVTPKEIAAFLVEPIQGEGGYYPASPAFLAELRRIADEHGILIIADEVQSGFGRTGDWFASQVLGLEPDIVVMGKAIANGLPLSAIGASRSAFEKWPPGSHGSTFGGNPVSSAAAVATVDALVDVIPGVAERSEHAFRRFRTLAERHPTIGDVRGMGLMIGVDLVDGDGKAAQHAFTSVSEHATREGLLILPCGPDGNVIRFIPPLNVTIDDLDAGIDMLENGLEAFEAKA